MRPRKPSFLKQPTMILDVTFDEIRRGNLEFQKSKKHGKVTGTHPTGTIFSANCKKPS